MNKRFKNSHLSARKKNRFSILVCAVSMTAALGMMTGCSLTKSSPAETQRDKEVPGESMNRSESESESKSNPDSTTHPEETLSEDGQELKNMAQSFAAAYFSGDTDTMQSYLTNPYEWGIEVYAGLDASGAGTVSDLTLKGLKETGKEETGSKQVLSLEFRDSNYKEMFLYLTMECIKQEDGWKIQFYGLEG